MNRFRTRRKAKEQRHAESYSRPDAPPVLSFGSKTFGKNKKPTPEGKPVIDLASALPPSNQFRTSLIMPNLSARFSMLREQDDPYTKIGKANDDSVLFPRRASRLNLFSHNPLTDIAEVDSIRDSINPPFAYGERKHSFDADGYDSDGGVSIMSRSRPGEGNNLFGGRQKLFKIPVDSSSKSQSSAYTPRPDSGGMGGRVMYENDVSLSLFQKHRDKERGGRRNQGRDSIEGAEDDSPHSPATSFTQDRGTTWSTASAPRRSSTAATSIESQSPSLNHNNGSAASLGSPQTATAPKPGVDRNATVYRKLYGQALYQSRSLQRAAKDVVDNLSRPRPPTHDEKVHLASTVKSDADAREGSPQPRATSPSSNFRSSSPPPSVSPPGGAVLDSTLRDAMSPEGVLGQMCGFQRPLSPPISDGEDAATFVNSLQPEDRGKATALGLFNKPCQHYDEHQFSQRQLQMHQGRSSPAPYKASPTPASTPASPEQTVLVSNTNDAPEQKPEAAQDARARVTSLVRHQKNGLASPEAQRRAIPRQSRTARPSSQDAVATNNFLDDDDEPPSKDAERTLTTLSTETRNDMHPALRSAAGGPKFPPFDTTSTSAQLVDEPRPVLLEYDDHDKNFGDDDDFDPSSERVGLSGLIRTHLRHDSDKSSIYAPTSPRVPSSFKTESPNMGASVASTSGHKPREPQLTDTQSNMAQNARQFLQKATLLKKRSNSQSRRSADEEAGQSSQDSQNARSWQEELHLRHHRGGSTETQQEREAFNHELAERRRKVQETLKSVVESNSRSVSPVLSAEPSPAKPATGLSAMLRSKTSRPKLDSSQPTRQIPQDHSSKAMKVLGLGGSSTPNVCLPSRPQQELWKEEEERMLEDFGRRRKLKQTFAPLPSKSIPSAPSEPPSNKTSPCDDAERSRQISVTPASTRSSLRDRSGSDHAVGSKSRNGPYRDDLEKAMAEGTGSHARIYDLSNASNVSMAARPSIEVAEQQPETFTSAMSGRYRSNSRPNPAGYFEIKPLKPLQTSGMSSSTSLSSRPSPRTPYSANSTPPILETSPAISNTSTTTLAQAPDGKTTPSLRDRKRSITKNMISDPTFISTTYSVTTVDLPPGASLRNGSPESHPKDSSAPAIPFMNPSRRRGRAGTGSSTTHTILSCMTGRANGSKADLSAPQSGGPSLSEERSNFSDEGDKKKPSPLRSRQRLRKVSSEGGDMSAKARYQALMAGPSPALPTFPVKRGPSPTMQRMEGGMF
jgi:hypothetical protein